MNKKPLLMSLTAVVATASIGVGATFALFSDQKAASTTLTAGQICLTSERDAGDNVPGPMFYMTGAQGSNGISPGRFPTAEISSTSPPGYIAPTPGNWAPGDDVARTLTVYNGGLGCTSIDVWLTKATASLHAGSYGPLTDKMHVTVRAQAPGGGMQIVAQDYLRKFLPVAEGGNGGVELKFPSGFHPDMPAYVGIGGPPNLQMEFDVKFDLNTPNGYQDKDMVVDFTVHAEQKAHNP